MKDGSEVSISEVIEKNLKWSKDLSEARGKT